mmetsp:Transcript_13090/g.14722  ORF Transcript_13090/g.14722 Transcript_13090/m.14722 type:complete len:331 (+) Transcript_13090:33-1025(+)
MMFLITVLHIASVFSLVSKSCFAFQHKSSSLQKLLPNLPSHSYHSTHFSNHPQVSSTVLNIKFRLDNDEEDDKDSNEFSYYSSKTNVDDKETKEEEIMMSSSFSSLPTTTFGAEAVPEAQRPANEYLDLLNSPLFDWANLKPNPTRNLIIRLSVLYVPLFALICWPIAGATFTESGYGLHKLFSSNVGAIGFILIFLLRLYSGWGYIGSRLQSKEIEYEETGWYDGDVEMKTEAEIARDLFLYRQDVKPVVERLQKFTFVVGSLWIASCIGLNVAFNNKPIFNEYDPEMLKILNYDDKVAGVAAQQSNGRPTYCDSRYYRAVANGGQGCN